MDSHRDSRRLLRRFTHAAADATLSTFNHGGASQHMWSDNETGIDLLGYHHLVGAVVEIVRADRLLPATIGVFGDWGSGKSSLVQMACVELATDETTLVLPFNG